ncbi:MULTISPECIES: thioesterase family protein [unclassified Azospirillum]|uniref:acyl-CoA thioesterase n=1 Tax=unclassified Azospirillum TaxID=2630922 RepID=UPI000B6CF911|nr:MULTISPECIES: thioesterase family protein [unclassified Azospirillum]SNS14503.1 (3S)-malyl-CoA thioesterase [Azospirillum sp. RU38E]SNS31669.1 (3S)-malyl-CoA thioesterase [Azospirillum sp. RU37A]
MAREPTPTRAQYRHFSPLGTRWMDNDVYGHVNNVTYYSYFDTAVNEYLIRAGVLDIHGGAVIGLVVETGCRYFAPVAFPDQLDIGIAVTKLGNSSVRYEVGIFRQGEEVAAAAGHFIHVYVDRENRRPTPLPDDFRAALTRLLVDN